MKIVKLPLHLYVLVAGKSRINCSDFNESTTVEIDCIECPFSYQGLKKYCFSHYGYSNGYIKVVLENGLSLHKLGKFYG